MALHTHLWCLMAAMLACRVAAEATTIHRREPFPDDLLDIHFVLIAVPMCVTVLAILVAAVVGCLRTLRMTVLLVLGTWLALVTVGVVSWVVTYVASRDAILKQAEQSLSLTATQAVSTVTTELGAGLDIMQMLRQLARTGVLNLDGAWPEPHLFLDRLMGTVGSRTRSIAMVYWATSSGRGNGVQIDTASGRASGMHLLAPQPGDHLPSWLQCQAMDWLPSCSDIATPAACANPLSVAAIRCTKSCGFPDPGQRNCLQLMVSFASAVVDSANVSSPNSIFRAPPPGRGMVMAFPLDPRTRPWYHHMDKPVWSPPYAFASSQGLGITVSSGVRTFLGELLGTVAVDYTFRSLNRLLQDLQPSKNGAVFLVTTDRLLVGSSMTSAELLQDTGVGEHNTIDAVNITQYARTESQSMLVRAIGAVLSEWGTLEAASAMTSMYQHMGDTVLSYPLNLQGMTLLLVVSVPLSDIMGEADSASTTSLVMTVCISIGLAVLAAAGLTCALLPLGTLRRNMYDVASMNVEGHTGGATSHLTEVRSMQESFAIMVRNLIEYKQYLPQSVLRAGSDEEMSSEPCSPRRKSGRMSVRSNGTSRSASSKFTALSSNDAGVAALANTGTKVRVVSVIVTNLEHFVDMSKTQNPAEFVAGHASYLEAVVLRVNSHRGIIDEFMGDKVHASFNTVFSSGMHRAHACECLGELNMPIAESTSFRVNAAAVSMKALCGNMGCKGLKKYTIVGASGRNVWTFERWGRAWGVPMLVDAGIAHDTKDTFTLRRIAMVRVATDRDIFIYELQGAKHTANEEWMYQIGTEDSCMQYNAAIEFLYSGAYDKAMDTLTVEGQETSALREWVALCKEQGRAPVPMPLTYVPDKHAAFCEADYKHLRSEVVRRASISKQAN